MKHLWAYIENKDIEEKSKYRSALFILSIIFAIAGFIAWLIVRTWTLSSIDWMICFIGYFVVAAWVVVFIYAGRHAFHDGNQ